MYDFSMFYFDFYKKRIKNFIIDHPACKTGIELTWCTIITILSALFYSFGFNTFINPNFTALANSGFDTSSIVIGQLFTNGLAGITQSIIYLMKFFNVEFLSDTVVSNIAYWVIYLILNIPVLLLALFGLGKRFGIFTIIDVILSVIFGIILKNDDPTFFVNQISLAVIRWPLLRVIFAGLCTGISSGLAYYIESSAGGVDIIVYYIGEKTSKQVGGYSIILNAAIVSIFAFVSMLQPSEIYGVTANTFAQSFVLFLCTFLYSFVTSFVVDKINTQNKKVLCQIITTKVNLSKSIIAALPHSCTIEKGIGGYSGEEKEVLYISIRKKELHFLLTLCKKEDPHCFTSVLPIDNVYGRFFRKRIK